MTAKSNKSIGFALVGAVSLVALHLVASAADQPSALASNRANDSASPVAKNAVAYQHALNLIEQATAQRDAKQRDELLDQAQAELKKWLARNSDPDAAVMARIRLGDLLRHRVANVLKAARPSSDSGSTNQLAAVSADDNSAHKQAQSLLQDAIAQFGESAKQLRAQLDAIPKGEQTELRTKIGLQWLDALLSELGTRLELAEALADGDPQRKQLLNDVAAQGANLYQRFPKLTGGWLAHYYEGLSYENLGDSAKALVAYQDLMVDLTDADTGFRPIKTQAMRGAWIVDSVERFFDGGRQGTGLGRKALKGTNCRTRIGWR